MDSDKDELHRLDSDAPSKSVEGITTTTEAFPIQWDKTFWGIMKKLLENRFSHPQKMKPLYTLEGR
jgi:hypothetical protein